MTFDIFIDKNSEVISVYSQEWNKIIQTNINLLFLQSEAYMNTS